jgi:hypothetical protein
LAVPLNALPVLYDEQAVFVPSDSILIFLSAYCTGDFVAGALPADALLVELTVQQPTAAVGFNDQSESFFLLTGAGRSPPTP